MNSSVVWMPLSSSWRMVGHASIIWRTVMCIDRSVYMEVRLTEVYNICKAKTARIRPSLSLPLHLSLFHHRVYRINTLSLSSFLLLRPLVLFELAFPLPFLTTTALICIFFHPLFQVFFSFVTFWFALVLLHIRRVFLCAFPCLLNVQTSSVYHPMD